MQTLCHDGLQFEAGHIVTLSISVSVAHGAVLTTVRVGATHTHVECFLIQIVVNSVPVIAHSVYIIKGKVTCVPAFEGRVVGEAVSTAFFKLLEMIYPT